MILHGGGGGTCQLDEWSGIRFESVTHVGLLYLVQSFIRFRSVTLTFNMRVGIQWHHSIRAIYFIKFDNFSITMYNFSNYGYDAAPPPPRIFYIAIFGQKNQVIFGQHHLIYVQAMEKNIYSGKKLQPPPPPPERNSSCTLMTQTISMLTS